MDLLTDALDLRHTSTGASQQPVPRLVEARRQEESRGGASRQGKAEDERSGEIDWEKSCSMASHGGGRREEHEERETSNRTVRPAT